MKAMNTGRGSGARGGMAVALVAAGALLASGAARLAAQEPAGSPRERLVVSPAWLAEHLDDANLVLLHVGERAEYDAGHIPGARYIQTQDVSLPRQPGALALELPPIADVRSVLEAKGISNDSRIVVYWGGDWVSPATRIVFALDAAGLGDRTSILDGGMSAWVGEGRPVVTEVPTERRGRLTERQSSVRVVDVEWVEEHVRAPRAGFALVDGRAGVYYDGVEASQGRNGHIPGAGSVPFTEVTDESGRIAGDAKLRSLLEGAGVKRGDVVVAYCHIGQQATAVLFAARLLGHEVRLFDGSMQEWARDPARLVERR